MSSELKIGSKVYIFDENRRVYHVDKAKHGHGPIYREHFMLVEITDESPRKWKTTGRGAFKKNPYETGFYTKEMVEDAVWDRENRHYIREAIYRTDVETLKKVAKLVGYKENPNE